MKSAKFMNLFKQTVIIISALIFLNYFKNAKNIVFAINKNLSNWNSVFMQYKNEKRHFFQYKNNIWFSVETKYDAIKRKCRNVLKTLKKIRYWLYDVHFVLKTNAEILMTQLNKLKIDLFDTLITK